MRTEDIRTRLANSPAARLAAFPSRTSTVARHSAPVVGRSFWWLFTSREHTNFTYNLTALNREYLAWFVAAVVEQPVALIRNYFTELESDESLANHIRQGVARSGRRGLADPVAKYGRRLGWYALIRSLKPDCVVETGTDKGLGSCVMASALLRNGRGRLTTFDVNAASGYLITGKFADVVDRRVQPSVDGIHQLPGKVDIFLHDSLHTYEYETAEFEAVERLLDQTSMVLSDNAELTPALAHWAERTDRKFCYFAEQPYKHWYPGGGIGIAYHPGWASPSGGDAAGV